MLIVNCRMLREARRSIVNCKLSIVKQVPLWKRQKTSMLGLDIGSASLKMVELGKSGERVALETYAEYQNPDFLRSFQPFTKNAPPYSQKELSFLIKQIAQEARVKSRDLMMSLPAPSTFIIAFELPFMSSDEIPTAVMHEARQRIPVPLGEVEIDWSLLNELPQQDSRSFIQILLAAVPKEIIAKYTEIARDAGFSLAGIEAEAFSLVRGLLRGERRPAIVVDIGASSTTINIVDRGNIVLSHNFWVGGGELTTKIMQSTGQSKAQAEYYKRKEGVLQSTVSESISRVIIPLVDEVLQEVSKVMAAYKDRFQRDIGVIILTGGSASLAGLKELFGTKFNKEVLVSNPFSGIFFPPILTPVIKEIGPSFSVAVGLALRGLE